VTGSAPRHLAVRDDGRVPCPDGTMRQYRDCYACPSLQGTLEGEDLVVLCGHGAPLPPLRFSPVTMDRPPVVAGDHAVSRRPLTR
jgi:hypothetical protein